ncbi:Cof-type HAD-IIB family hydrolase [Bacillus taeanensis]|uniref:Cof-type HAD-IIB family hydrolase n=1 Tax=Bacillus taeanensis TaxID=273032 RepID=A0A366Y2K4_9BACI|nr:Cof-type HAD-IIB family hydrolase [Bacillus taeanensis]RBW71229.1 Cof-type HAD-IIB family hydrolase [Bacillus taeanensis]
MKLIAIDLDGTLLNHHSEISQENIKAVNYARTQGIEVVIATGRAYFDVCRICDRAGLSSIKVISANGAALHSEKGKPLRSIPMERSDVEMSLKWLEENEFYYEVFTEKAIYTPQNSRDIMKIEIDRLKSANPNINEAALHEAAKKQYSQTGFAFVDGYQDILNTHAEVYNILAFSFDGEKRTAGWKHFKQYNHFTLVSSADHNFELEHKEASKGNALEMLAESLNIPLKETIAVGDSYNDVSMFQKAGVSVAMGNAKEDIKALCSMTTLTNDENGVAHAIYKIVDQAVKA